jgi:YVTN family beta-propeller protein
MAVDPDSGVLAVADSATGTLSFFRDGSSIASLVVGLDPVSLAFDDSLGVLFVAEERADRIVVVNLSSFRVNGTFALVGPPTQVALDAPTSSLWIGINDSSNLTEVNATVGVTERTVSLGGVPASFALAPMNETLWAAIPSQHLVSLVNTSNGTVFANVSVASGDSEIALDAPSGLGFVANASNDTLTRIALTPTRWPTVSETTSLLDGPVETLAYGPATQTVDALLTQKDQLELLNASSLWAESGVVVPDNVSGFTPSGTNDTVYLADPSAAEVLVETITTPTVVNRFGSGEFYWGAGWLTFDPANDVLYAVIWDQSKVVALNLSSDTVESTLPVGEFVAGATLDTAHGLLVVADGGGSSLNLINTTTNREIANVSNPQASWLLDPLYDPGTGRLYVTDNILNTVFVYCWTGSDYEPCRTITMASILNAEWGTGYLTLDSADQHLFVSEEDVGYETVIDASTSQILANIRVGSVPGVPAYDPANGLVYVPSAKYPSVSVIDPSTNAVTANLSLPCVPVMTEYDSGSGNVFALCEYSHVVVIDSKTDSVQSWFLSVPCDTNDLGDAGPGFALDDSLHAAFVSDSDITCEPNGLDMAELAVPQATSNGTLAAVPGIGPVTANRTATEIGEPVTFSATVEVQAAGLQYVWNGLPLGCTGSTNPIQCRPDVAGAYSVILTVDSSTGFSASGGPLAFTVYPDASAGPPDASWSSADVGQSIDFLANVVGGSGGGWFAWSFGEGLQCAQSLGPILSCTADSAGEWNVSYVWTDSIGNLGSGDTQLTIAVYPAPDAVLVPSPKSSALGAEISLTTVASGGAAPYSYAYFGLPGWCPSENRSDLTCTSATAGTFVVTVAVTDSNGVTAEYGASFNVSQSIALPPPSSGSPAPPSPGAGEPSSEWFLYLVAGAVGGVMVAALSLKHKSRR